MSFVRRRSVCASYPASSASASPGWLSGTCRSCECGTGKWQVCVAGARCVQRTTHPSMEPPTRPTVPSLGRMPPPPPPREPVCAASSNGKDTLSPQMIERMKAGCVVYKHDFNRTKRVRKLLCLSEEDGKQGKWTALKWRNYEGGSGSQTSRNTLTPRSARQSSSPASPRRSFADLILTPRGSSEGGSTGVAPSTPPAPCNTHASCYPRHPIEHDAPFARQ